MVALGLDYPDIDHWSGLEPAPKTCLFAWLASTPIHRTASRSGLMQPHSTTCWSTCPSFPFCNAFTRDRKTKNLTDRNGDGWTFRHRQEQTCTEKHRQTQSDRHANIQADWHRGRQASRHTDIPTGRQTDKQTSRQADKRRDNDEDGDDDGDDDVGDGDKDDDIDDGDGCDYNGDGTTVMIDHHVSSEPVLIQYLSILSAHKRWVGAACIQPTRICIYKANPCSRTYIYIYIYTYRLISGRSKYLYSDLSQS